MGTTFRSKPYSAAEGIQIGNLEQIVGYLQAQQQLQNMLADIQSEVGIGNLYGSIPGSLVGQKGGGRVPTLAARELEANMMANPRDFIKLAFMRAGQSTPGGLRPLENTYLTGKLYRQKGEREVYYVDPQTGQAHWITNPDAFKSIWGGQNAGDPWAQVQEVNPGWVGQNFQFGQNIDGGWQGFEGTQPAGSTTAPAKTPLGYGGTGPLQSPYYYPNNPNPNAGQASPYRMDKGGQVVEGPAISTVGEKGPEFALLAPGSVVAPRQNDGPMDMEQAIMAIIMQILKGLGQEGGMPQEGMSQQAPQPMAGMPQHAYDGLTTFHPNTGQNANLNDIPKIPFINQLLQMQGGQTSNPWVGTNTPFGSAGTVNPYNANTAFALNNAMPTDYSMALGYNSAFGIPDEDTQATARQTIEGYGLVPRGTRGLISNLLR